MDTNRGQTNKGRRARGADMDGFITGAPALAVSKRAAATKRAVAGVPSQTSLAKPAAKRSKQKRLNPETIALLEQPLVLEGAPERGRKRPRRILRRHLSVRAIALRGAALCVALFLATGGFLFWRGYTQVHKVFRGTGTVTALSSKEVAPELLKGEGDGRVNILLLGVGGEGHAGSDLTDTILILSVDPVNNTAAFLSVPRDLWVKMPVNYFGAYQKLNAAYSSGKYHTLGKVDASNADGAAVEAGFASIDQALGDVLGLRIDYHVLVNFQAFRQAIDTVGGVQVNVTEQLYDPTMAWENNWNPVLAPAGVQTMDGKKALMYARSRETTSDFARTQRQRQIMLALKDKVLTAGTLSNPAKIEGLMTAFGDNVYTDLSTQGAQRLFSIVKKIDDTKIASLGLAQAPNVLVTTDHVGTASVVRPVAGFDNYTAIQAYVRSQLVDGYLTKEHAPVLVAAPTAASAAAAAAELKTYGYNVSGTATAITSGDKPTVVDLSGGKDTYTRNYLEKRYGVKAITFVPGASGVQPNGAKFVIILTK